MLLNIIENLFFAVGFNQRKGMLKALLRGLSPVQNLCGKYLIRWYLFGLSRDYWRMSTGLKAPKSIGGRDLPSASAFGTPESRR
jgi:hypothetical protein